ncbi:MAG: NUDIX domain-containing protein [Candidatus Absconditabacteria bacterium]
MNILKTFDLLGSYGSETQPLVREACRIVLLDQGLIPILFVSKENYYKLPGGGIETGEDKQIALAREIFEETGCVADITKEVGIVIQQSNNRKQISYCYIGKVLQKGTFDFTEDELEKGFELQRVSIEQGLKLISNCIPLTVYGKDIQQRDAFILEYIYHNY